jgi:hypothetical protein
VGLAEAVVLRLVALGEGLRFEGMIDDDEKTIFYRTLKTKTSV